VSLSLKFSQSEKTQIPKDKELYPGHHSAACQSNYHVIQQMQALKATVSFLSEEYTITVSEKRYHEGNNKSHTN
jgi:hypothetical protein